MCADFFAHLRGRPDEITELESIRDNLNWLLNSRIGFLPHIKDYGIRDLSDVANHKTPREDLRRDIEKAIHRFEPRITALEVEEYEDSVESLKPVSSTHLTLPTIYSV